MSALPSHQQLRIATAHDHAQVDTVFSGFELSSARGYGGFLRAHAAAVAALEPALCQAGLGDGLPDWNTRQRLPALQADLAALGLPAPAPMPAPPLPDAAAAWGAAYVLEGSRLGGAVLLRRLAPELPSAYLGGRLPAGSWPAFLKAMDAALIPPEARERAVDAAKASFALFATAGQQQLEAISRD